jgi:hypothetical protein
VNKKKMKEEEIEIDEEHIKDDINEIIEGKLFLGMFLIPLKL